MSKKIKDYILDTESVTCNEHKNDKNDKKANSFLNFSVVVQNNTDFVVKRETSTTDFDLVFLVSQSQFYIRNNKKESIEKLNIKTFKNFMKSFHEAPTLLNLVYWYGDSSTIAEKRVEALLGSEGCREYVKHSMSFDSVGQLISRAELFKSDPKLFKYTLNAYNTKIMPRFTTKDNRFTEFFKMALMFKERINYNNAIFFIDAFSDSGVFFDLAKYREYAELFMVYNLIKDFSLDFIRFITYITRDLYSQGIEFIHSNIIGIYKDYLRMSSALYGKVKEKYPKNLKTDHDKVSLLYSLHERHKKELSLFKVNEQVRYLEFETKTYSILLPKTSLEIVAEGINLSHCSASYVNRVVKGDSILLFLRLTSEIDTPLVTIEIKEIIDSSDDSDGSKYFVNHVAGFSNRIPTLEEDEFLRKWAKKKKLRYKSKIITVD